MSIDNDVIDKLLEQYKTPDEILGKDGLIKQLTKAVLERALDAEMQHHLTQERQEAVQAVDGRAAGRGNVRNGRSRKTVSTDHGEFQLTGGVLVATNHYRDAPPPELQREHEPVPGPFDVATDAHVRLG